GTRSATEEVGANDRAPAALATGSAKIETPPAPCASTPSIPSPGTVVNALDGGGPSIETGGPVTVHHPRFTSIPGLSGHINPSSIARAISPSMQRLHVEQPFDMVDAQFFYPDGPAAMRVAEASGSPFAIKARGSDIHYWGTKPFASRQMRAAAEKASVSSSVSQALTNDMAALGSPAGKMHVHYTG
ncbi:hypothetical protein OY671_008801, partial [Metschnikowia pulcherrima]